MQEIVYRSAKFTPWHEQRIEQPGKTEGLVVEKEEIAALYKGRRSLRLEVLRQMLSSVIYKPLVLLSALLVSSRYLPLCLSTFPLTES